MRDTRNTHVATDALPPSEQPYTAPVDVLRYLSPAFAETTPDPENTVAFAEVPVIAVPWCQTLPSAPSAPSPPVAPFREPAYDHMAVSAAPPVAQA